MSTESYERTCKSLTHKTTCFSTMNTFRSSETLCDVVLLPCAGEVRIPAHRLVLAIASPYFEAMFTSGMLESRESIVRLPDIEPEPLKSLVDFCYTGIIHITTSNAEAIFLGAHLFQLGEVVGFCERALIERVNETNCLLWAKIADQYDCKELKTISYRCVAFHLTKMTDDEDFLSLPADVLAQILSLDDLAVKSESEVISIIEKWINYDLKNRGDALTTLLESTRFYFLSEADVESLTRWENYASARFIRNCVRTSSEAIRIGRKSPLLAIRGSTTSKEHSRVESYCPIRNEWIKFAPLNISRTEMGVVSLGDSVYVLGGSTGNSGATVERYDAGEGRWIMDVPNMIKARKGNAYAECCGSIYAFGSYAGERYDPRANVWQEIELPDYLRCPVTNIEGVLSMNGQVLVFLAYLDQEAYAYDPVLGCCSHDHRFLGYDLWNGANVVKEQCLYHVGKRGNVDIFDSRVGKWSGCAAKSDLSPLDVVSDDTKLYAVGERLGTFYCQSFSWLDFRMMTWNEGPRLPKLRGKYRHSCGIALL
ncbi:kelch-like protein 17 [Oscarella lobularis]|uniref:kelch-like protein 17 n=1 Tax=Oscarella lobularis TaxID=121494 RepID=UPI0033141EDA